MLDPGAKRTRSLTRALALPVLGAGVVVALAVQLWRGVGLERAARTAELARALAVAEAILREAPASAVAFASRSAAVVWQTGADGIVPDAELGWLWPLASPLDDDPVVAYRLERAARAEFAAGDAERARAEFDELLAGTMLPVPRLQSLAAAAWQSERAGAAERLADLASRADELLATLQPADLARPAVARSVAAVLRLPRPVPPPWASRLVPWLPAEALAGLPATADTAAAERRSAQRLAAQALDRAWQAARVPAGTAALLPFGERLLWAQPEGAHHRLQALTAAEFLGALQQAGELGALPRWPWLVAAEWGPTATACAGIPGLRALRPADDLPVWSPWLAPAATVVLLAALAWAIAARLRASAREGEALAAQAEFLTNVTHELKTPLAAIRLLAEMLAEGRAVGR
ncbi:MAG: hypothetical protein JNK49_14780, partial [Planctomycetes bacterium]|nr:hypothetical protein [Planctomycetota bacterium]